MLSIKEGPILIAGPCSAENRDQIVNMAAQLKELGVDNMRASLWKPRTRPGFDGVGESGLPWFGEASQLGITMGTEVMLPIHAEKVIDELIVKNGAPQVLIWLGSRNQNHLIQRDIGLASKGAPVKLMIKNQPWFDKAHWLGIVDHVLSSGFSEENIILCHRGFTPGKNESNPSRLRNLPDWEMAHEVEIQTGLPMIIDSSHIGGSVQNVINVTGEALLQGFDNFILEVHPNPEDARTDAKQQLTVAQFAKLQQLIQTVPLVRQII